MKWTTFIFMLGLCHAVGQNHVALLAPGKESVVNAITKGKSTNEINISLISGLIGIKAIVDGDTGIFILDTGAPGVLLNQKPEPKTLEKAIGVSGDTKVASIVLRNFEWGNQEFENVEALAIDLEHLKDLMGKQFSGLLGYSALKDLELLFDLRNSKLTIFPASKNALHKAHKPKKELLFRMYDHLPVIPLTINGKKLFFGFDTGASVNLIDEKWLSTLKKENNFSVTVDHIQGIDRQVKNTLSTKINDVVLGDLLLNPMEFQFTDLSQLKTSGGLGIDGIIGFPFIKQMKCSINYFKRKIYVWNLY